jgi:hypothetical protein
VALEYVFNDMDYLKPARRQGPQEAAGSLAQRLNPVRSMFHNSFLFQQVYARYAYAPWKAKATEDGVQDPYRDSTMLARHLQDLSRLSAEADSAGTLLVVVPVDVSVAADSGRRVRYHGVADLMIHAGLRVIPAADALEGRAYDSLIVNTLDHHPNEIANAALAVATAPVIASFLPAAACTGPGGGGNHR